MKDIFDFAAGLGIMLAFVALMWLFNYFMEKFQ